MTTTPWVKKPPIPRTYPERKTRKEQRSLYKTAVKISNCEYFSGNWRTDIEGDQHPKFNMLALKPVWTLDRTIGTEFYTLAGSADRGTGRGPGAIENPTGGGRTASRNTHAAGAISWITIQAVCTPQPQITQTTISCLSRNNVGTSIGSRVHLSTERNPILTGFPIQRVTGEIIGQTLTCLSTLTLIRGGRNTVIPLRARRLRVASLYANSRKVERVFFAGSSLIAIASIQTGRTIICTGTDGGQLAIQREAFGVLDTKITQVLACLSNQTDILFLPGQGGRRGAMLKFWNLSWTGLRFITVLQTDIAHVFCFHTAGPRGTWFARRAPKHGTISTGPIRDTGRLVFAINRMIT